jgi:hypothetical protein
MKQLNEYIIESLLDTDDEIFDKIDLNIFNHIANSKTENEFYEQVNILKDLCIAVDINDKLSKYKNSFFLMEVVSKFNKSDNKGIIIDKYFDKTKCPLSITPLSSTARYWGGHEDENISTIVCEKHTFDELKHEYHPTLKSDTVYVIPKDIEKQYKKWVKSLTDRYLGSTNKRKVI